MLLEKSQPFCLKMTYTFPKKYEVTKITIFRLFIFFKNLINNLSKIGFSMKNDPWRFDSMCCARTAALQGGKEKRM